MPLRDHFHSPLDDMHSWDELHGGWPMVIVMALKRKLPRGYTAAPRVYLGALAEVEVASFGLDELGTAIPVSQGDDGGVATAVWAPTKPTLEIVTDMPAQDEYEVRVYDAKRNRRLVAAVEIVSPSNKDRPERRRAFVEKCASMIRQQVSVANVDIVTSLRANLYGELLDSIGQTDPTVMSPESTYAAVCRWTPSKRSGRLQSWHQPLAVGEPLPTLPLWLTPTYAVPLELEATYEETCFNVSID
jgi:hypothetical protein